MLFPIGGEFIFGAHDLVDGTVSMAMTGQFRVVAPTDDERRRNMDLGEWRAIELLTMELSLKLALNHRGTFRTPLIDELEELAKEGDSHRTILELSDPAHVTLLTGETGIELTTLYGPFPTTEVVDGHATLKRWPLEGGA